MEVDSLWLLGFTQKGTGLESLNFGFYAGAIVYKTTKPFPREKKQFQSTQAVILRIDLAQRLKAPSGNLWPLEKLIRDSLP